MSLVVRCDEYGTPQEAPYELYNTHHPTHRRRTRWQCRWKCFEGCQPGSSGQLHCGCPWRRHWRPNSELDPRHWWCSRRLRPRYWLHRLCVLDWRCQRRFHGVGRWLSESEDGPRWRSGNDGVEWRTRTRRPCLVDMEARMKVEGWSRPRITFVSPELKP